MFAAFCRPASCARLNRLSWLFEQRTIRHHLSVLYFAPSRGALGPCAPRRAPDIERRRSGFWLPRLSAVAMSWRRPPPRASRSRTGEEDRLL
eukprot:15063835-Alexandrium_andersonii.AAC.2